MGREEARVTCLSWPTDSPEPSSFGQPVSLEAEPFSHFSSSSAVILTVLLKSLGQVNSHSG